MFGDNYLEDIEVQNNESPGRSHGGSSNTSERKMIEISDSKSSRSIMNALSNL